MRNGDQMSLHRRVNERATGVDGIDLKAIDLGCFHLFYFAS